METRRALFSIGGVRHDEDPDAARRALDQKPSERGCFRKDAGGVGMFATRDSEPQRFDAEFMGAHAATFACSGVGVRTFRASDRPGQA